MRRVADIITEETAKRPYERRRQPRTAPIPICRVAVNVVTCLSVHHIILYLSLLTSQRQMGTVYAIPPVCTIE